MLYVLAIGLLPLLWWMACNVRAGLAEMKLQDEQLADVRGRLELLGARDRLSAR